MFSVWNSMFTYPHITFLTLSLPQVTKTEFLLTMSIQYKQAGDENREEYQLWDY